ncbi:hypothetical protein SDJN02_06988, partial [Cucurbita argyrosperma subsp. argyrosperma]
MSIQNEELQDVGYFDCQFIGEDAWRFAQLLVIVQSLFILVVRCELFCCCNALCRSRYPVFSCLVEYMRLEKYDP